jgi:NAD(P)-dependent dehydrogenase (short-subunit alcohol dehydrogenase family)
MPTLQLAVVTGGNRGLGLEVCRQLARRGLKVILTARDPAKGEQAARLLASEALDVRFHVLNAANEASIVALAEFIRTEYGRLDVLVNNAGIFPDPSSSSVFDARVETVHRGMEVNAYGPLMLCQRLIPLMDGYGRVVNVSSGMGQLSDMNGCCPGYRLSKTALNAVTRIFADELKDTGVKINSVCPGWVRTDMGTAEADRPVEEGAAGIVGLALLPDDGPSGGFFRDMRPIPW